MKKNYTLKTAILVCCYFSFLVNAMSQKWVNISEKGKTKTEISLISSLENEIIVEFSVNEYKFTEVLLSTGKAINPVIHNGTPLFDKGAPNVQKLAKSIIIPDKEEMQAEVLSADYIEINNIDMAPSKGSFNRTINPESVAYTYDENYEQNTFFPGKLVSLGDAFILKNFRGQTIYTYPLQYNPVTKILRVYKSIKVKITSTETDGINQIARDSEPEQIDMDFEKTYENLFLNYDKTRYTPISETGKMLIISHANYISTMQSFVAWKKLKGIPTEMVDIASIGNTTTAITNYIKNYYSTTSDKTLKFVLLVGDYAQITSPQVSEPGYASNKGPADITYGYTEGTDHYAEVFVGRFSCETVADAQTQIDRTINYERNLKTTDTWINKGLVVGSNDLTETNYNGEYDWDHLRNKIRADMLASTYTSVAEMYDGSQGGGDASGNPTASMVSASINEGIGNFVYSGHAEWNSLLASGFSTTNASALTNVGKLPHIWVLGCNPGQFQDHKCLAECLLRAQSNNNPTGAITAYMSSISQMWDPPYAQQIEMIDILSGQFPSNYKITAGGLANNSCVKMIELFPTTQGGEFTADTWILFGDPSVVVFTDNPTAMTVTHESSITKGATEFVVNCNVANALISLTVGGEILATAYSNGGANTITFGAPLNTTSASMQVTVTAQNKVTYLADVSILNTSVNNMTENNNADIYLNPLTNNIHINLDENIFNGTIYDISGRAVLKFKNTNTVNISSLENGVYLFNVMAEDTFISKKMLYVKKDN